MRRLAGLFLFVSGVCGAQSPSVKPEPRARISGDPEAIYQTALKDSEEVRLLAVNLDEDEALERVVVRRRDPDEYAAVYDFDGKAWWRVGEFSQNILVREPGHGTGVMQTNLKIFRMREGRLYPVFRTIEQNDYDTGGPGTKGERHVERRNVIYTAQGDALIVHRTEAVDPDMDAPCRPRSVACSVYRWDRGEFRFLRDLEADAAHCDRKTRQPLGKHAAACGADQ
jgi:hypothetical protein